MIDLVGLEDPQRVVQGLERVGVAEVAARVQAGAVKRRQRRLEPLVRLLLAPLEVGRPASAPAACGRARAPRP